MFTDYCSKSKDKGNSSEEFSNLDTNSLILELSADCMFYGLSVEKLEDSTEAFNIDEILSNIEQYEVEQEERIQKKKEQSQQEELAQKKKEQSQQEEQKKVKEKNPDLLTVISDQKNVDTPERLEYKLSVEEQKELEIYIKEQDYKLSELEFQVLTTSRLLSRDIYDYNQKNYLVLLTSNESLNIAIKNFRKKQQEVCTKEKIVDAEYQYFANIDTLEKYGINTTSKIKFSLYKSCFEDCVEKHTTQAGINQINAALLEFINHCDKQILIKKKNNQLVSMSDNIHTYGASMYDFGSTKVYKEVLLAKIMRAKSGNVQNYISIRFFILKSDNSSDNDKALEYLKLETPKIRSYSERLGYTIRVLDNNKNDIIKKFHCLNLSQGLKRKYHEDNTK